MQILTVDIGASMQDILLFDSERGAVKMTIPSPTMLVARAIQAATRRGDDLYLTGVAMGGGPCTKAVRDHIQAGCRVYAAPGVAYTFAHDVHTVRKMGVHIIPEHEHPPGAVRLEMRDLDFASIIRTFMSFGVSADPDALALAVFDHGTTIQDSRFAARFAHLGQHVQVEAGLTALAHTRANIPANMPRMQAVASSAPPTLPLIVMDPAFAALLGGYQDAHIRRRKSLLIAHLGTMHTLVAHIRRGKITGLVEHHTSELNPRKLEHLLTALIGGTLDAGHVLDGHGALILDHTPSRSEFLAVTGVKSNLLCGIRYHPYFAAPYGDTEFVGCWGLVHAYAALHPQYAPRLEAALTGRDE